MDIRTREVSLVDRPANKRKFLVRKHEDAVTGESADSVAPSSAGVELDEALVGLIVAFEKFENEPDAHALVSGEVLDEVKELTARLCACDSQETPMDKQDQVQDTPPAVAPVIEPAAVEPAAVEPAVVAAAPAVEPAAASDADTVVEKRGNSAGAWQQIANRAASISARLKKGPPSKQLVDRMRGLMNAMQAVMGRMKGTAKKGEVLVIAEDADAAQVAAALTDMLEADDHEEALEAVAVAETDLTAAEASLVEATPAASAATEPPVEEVIDAELVKSVRATKAALDSANSKITKLEGELTQTRSQLQKSLTVPAPRASNSEPPAPVDQDKAAGLFPLSYTAPKRV